VYPFASKTKNDEPFRVLEYHDRYCNEELIKYIPYHPSLFILDCGCTEGVLLDQLDGRSQTSWGIDRSLAALGDNLTREQVSVAAYEHLPFAGNTFDALLGQDTMAQSADPAGTLAEFARVLRPGGYLILWERRRSLDMQRTRKLKWIMSGVGLAYATEEPFDWLAFPTAALLDTVPLLATSDLAQTLTKAAFAIDTLLARASALRDKSWHVIVVAQKRIDH
jgi:ubiquinone/menaquinone biosynthesis C-methylase UbiE